MESIEHYGIELVDDLWTFVSTSVPAVDETGLDDLNASIDPSYGPALEDLMNKQDFGEAADVEYCRGFFRFLARVNGVRKYLCTLWQREDAVNGHLETLYMLYKRNAETMNLVIRVVAGADIVLASKLFDYTRSLPAI